jgi:hypothetical protein
MPDIPFKSRAQAASAPTPKGETSPRPVTTTRRMLYSSLDIGKAL